MTLRKHGKKNARRALDGNWGRAIGILLISTAIYLIFTLLRGMTALLANIPEFQDIFGTPGYFLDDVPGLTAASLAMELCFLGIWLVINAPLALGVCGWYYELGGGKSEELSSVFSFFGGARIFGRALWLRVNLWVRRALWAVLFGAVPVGVYLTAGLAPTEGIRLLLILLGTLLALLATVFYFIAVNRYFLAQYLLGRYPEMKAREAIRCSVREMKGGRTEVFLLQLSFLPWALLCVLLLPVLYVFPYYRATQALYARYFIERARRAGTLPEETPVDEGTGEEPLEELPASQPPSEME